MNMLIGLTGIAGSGKSYAANYLAAEYGYMRVSFAAPLKAMLDAMLVHADVPHSTRTDMIFGHLKEVPHPALSGKSPRHAMQTLGTEWGRDCIRPDFWCDLLEQRIRNELLKGTRVVVDDVRFENEAAMLRRLGGIVARVQGRKPSIITNHVSENGVSFDNTLMNREPNQIEAELDVLHAHLKEHVYG